MIIHFKQNVDLVTWLLHMLHTLTYIHIYTHVHMSRYAITMEMVNCHYMLMNHKAYQAVPCCPLHAAQGIGDGGCV